MAIYNNDRDPNEIMWENTTVDLKQELIEEVLNQIKEDITNGDVEPVLELLNFCPTANLMYYLPEEKWDKYNEIKSL